LLKGEKKKKPLISGKGFFGKKINISKPELSGKTSKKIKRAVVGATSGWKNRWCCKKSTTFMGGIPRIWV
jgi:hypothetical protein